jgi:polysaccharide pyruvyl transferase WcaK-like protein
MSKVICLGYFGRGNSGDEAFKLAHEWLLGAENIEFHSARMTAEQVAGRPVILGGGDVVAPFFLDWVPPGTPFSMVGVGLKYEQSSIRALEERGSDLTFSWYRNKIDVELTQAAGMKSAYIPDIVFSLREHREEIPPRLMEKLMSNIGNPTAIVCLADHFNNRVESQDPRLCAYLEYMKWELAAALDTLSKDTKIVFFPLSVYANHQDARLHYEVAKRMKRRKYVTEIRESIPPGLAISMFRRADYVISMKLHGNIYGLLTERACVNIGIGRKQTKLYEEAGLQAISLDPYSFTKDRFLAALEQSKTDAVRKKISKLALDNFKALKAFRAQIRDYVGLGSEEEKKK